MKLIIIALAFVVSAVIFVGISKAFAATAASAPVAIANAKKSDRDAVMSAYDNFYVALNEMFAGSAEKMVATWSHSDDVSYMGPDDLFLKGWKNIAANWHAQAAKKMGGKVVPQDVHVVIGSDIAITNNYEVGENLDAKGEVVKVSIRATNVFRKENGEWKMISHHTDLLPFLSDKKSN
ncbi:MAG: nuclear transport factor 2 family protein [Alphaproteobacteria bacterium]|nr:nuclear transport factor 2 family protein [Alphaproteobacteria bacterium]